MGEENKTNGNSDSKEKEEKEDEGSQSFPEWLKINKKYFLFILFLFPLAIKYWEYFRSNEVLENLSRDNHLLIAISAALQCLFILFAIFLPVKEILFRATSDKDKESGVSETGKTCAAIQKNKLDEDEKKANTALMQFKSAWTFLWTSFFLLYLTLFIKYLNLSVTASSLSEFFYSLNMSITYLPDPLFSLYESISCRTSFLRLYENFSYIDNILKTFMNLFNNSATAVFVICYLVFAKKTAFYNESQASHQEQSSSSNSPDEVRLKRTIGLLVVILVLLGIIDFSFPGNGITQWVSAILAGIAMAFFLGRLNNKFINPSILIIVCLYAYMAIQTLFPFWLDSQNDFIVLLSANLAFIFKIVLYLFMLWLLRSGRLLFYFKNERKLMQPDNVNGKTDWEEFQSSGVFIMSSAINDKTSGNDLGNVKSFMKENEKKLAFKD